MSMMDPFVIQHSIELLRNRLDAEMRDTQNKFLNAQNKIQALDSRVNSAEALSYVQKAQIDNLTNELTDREEKIMLLNGDLNQMKLANIKQEITIRTLSNLAQYDAHGMYVDTFTTADGIDWDTSVRATWMEDLKAVGKTASFGVVQKQEHVSMKLLITANPGEDNGLSQIFRLNKDQDIGQVSLYIEKHSGSTWKPVNVIISSDMNGNNVLAQGTLPATEIAGEGWYNIPVSKVPLAKLTDYYLIVKTTDTYGYRIGVDLTTDGYFAGTSYVLYNNVWTDNNHDISFKVWCYPAADENNASIVTIARELDEDARSIIFEAESSTFSGTINFHVSRDGGISWKILERGVETMLGDLPEGTELRIKAHIEGDSRVDAWGYVLTRGEIDDN